MAVAGICCRAAVFAGWLHFPYKLADCRRFLRAAASSREYQCIQHLFSATGSFVVRLVPRCRRVFRRRYQLLLLLSGQLF
jgi:hypothetical protein